MKKSEVRESDWLKVGVIVNQSRQRRTSTRDVRGESHRWELSLVKGGRGVRHERETWVNYTSKIQTNNEVDDLRTHKLIISNES